MCGGPVEYPWFLTVRVEAVRHFPHVLEPRVDDLRLARFAERIGREAGEPPVAILDMTAADHEDERLPSALGDTFEVVS